MPRNNTTKMSVRLLKNITAPEQALKEENRLELIELTGNPTDKQLWAGQIYGGDPSWFKFFNQEEIQRLQAKSIFGAGGGAVLLVRVIDTVVQGQQNTNEATSHRWMAVCFGMGFQALKPEKIEPNFGTIVALNKIGQNLIRSIDTKRPEDSTIQTRTQSSKKGDIFDFGVDTNRIILHSITGGCDDESFATTITGHEGLSINCEVNYETVSRKCQSIHDAYLLTEYETRAPWYGKILPVKQQEQISALNDQLLILLSNQSPTIHLAPPEIVDFQEIEKFRFSGPYVRSNRDLDSGDGLDDLDISDFYARLRDSTAITLEALENTDILVSYGESGTFRKKWSLFKCLVCEISNEVDGTFHVLSNGEWYAINNNFVSEVRDAISLIPEADFTLPNFNDEIHREMRAGKSCLSEGTYNTSVSEAMPENYFLCDRTNIPFTGQNGPVEFCDLFSSDKKIIHVKMRGASSNLSHLFMQGFVSADAFRNSQPFRDEIRSRVPLTSSYILQTQPVCPEYEIVFAFIQSNQRYLPFFSQIALKAVYQMIRNMDYKVSILWIDRDRIANSNDTEEEDLQDVA